MKKLSLLFFAILSTGLSFAQAPNLMSYQAVIRNASNTLVSSTTVGMQISILQGSAVGTAVYVETHTPTTNLNGLATVEIGGGTPVSGTFGAIQWAAGPFFVKVQTDPAGGTSYSVTSISQLLSVPYALHSGSVSSSGIVGKPDRLAKYATSDSTLTYSNVYETGNNVGINEPAPTYKFQVTHAGGTGILNKSTSGYSVVDIDAASGDAALRFGNAGVNQWNIRNQPGTDNLQIFELGGGGERFQIQNSTGYVGISEPNPTYRLHVTHQGSTGILSKSATGSGQYSVLDIDADNGDAALRLQYASASQWIVRNQPTSNNFQIIESFAGERLQIQDGTGNVGINMTSPTARLHVGGSFTATGAKAFTIDHPLDPENKLLRHFSIESPEVLNLYSGVISTDANGHALVQLPDYFSAINKDFRYQLTVIGTFAQAIISKEINGNVFEISTNQPNVKVSWEVTGVRNDGYMQYVNTMSAEEIKPAAMKGKYIEPKAFNMPESKGVNYKEEKENNSATPVKIPAGKPKVIENGGSVAN